MISETRPGSPVNLVLSSILTVGVGVEVEFDIKLHLLDLTLASCAGADVNELVNGGMVRAEVRQSREA